MEETENRPLSPSVIVLKFEQILNIDNHLFSRVE